MLFNTFDFVLFLPLVIILYFLIPYKFRWTLLLAASYYFYMSWKVEYIFLIIFSTLIDYYCGIKMEERIDRRAKLPLLILSITTNLGLLFFFKYFNFTVENLNQLFQQFGISKELPIMKFLLPVGISFYTFQTLSYSIDVYFGRQKAEKHLGYFALYVSFFPQLVAGPIERFSNLQPQLRAKNIFTYDNLANGLRLILFGLFIKMVIADNLSIIVDQIYDDPSKYSSFDIIKGISFYSFQIYSDFYGYSLIAIGSSLIMGIKLMDNFKTPYMAKNITEFWQRWHISLSTWFRDYLYYPLGGNRVAKYRWLINIMIVFVVSGIWHGANWTFIIWGTLFGLIYLFENILNKTFGIQKQHSDYSFWHIILSIKTYVFVTIIWIFFRSQNFEESMHIFKLIGNGNIGNKTIEIPAVTWIFLSVFIIFDIVLYNKRFDSWIGNLPNLGRWVLYSLFIFAIVVFAGVEDFSFIYFQF